MAPRGSRTSLSARAAAVGTALAVAGGLAVAAAPSASAAGKDGICQTGELCLYYLTDFRRPVFDLFVSDGDFRNDRFPGTTISANNNTESFWSRDTFTWDVYTGTFRTGARGIIPPGRSGNFSLTFKNTVSSAYFR